MSFFHLHVRDWLKNNSEIEELYLPLNVIRGKNIKVEPEVDVKVTDLVRATQDNRAYKHFLNKGDGGVSFKIGVVIGKKDRWRVTVRDESNNVIVKNPLVTDVLAKIYGEMLICSIETDAIDIPNGNYIVTKNSSRTQTQDHVTIWELEFTTYYPLQSYVYDNTNDVVLKSIADANAKRLAEINASKPKPTPSNKELFKACDWKVMVYSATEKVVNCNKYLQNILKAQGFYSRQVDGWFGGYTRDALKAFQKKYASKYGLSVTGKMDQKTFDALCKV